jgi:hypothetical protein
MHLTLEREPLAGQRDASRCCDAGTEMTGVRH